MMICGCGALAETEEMEIEGIFVLMTIPYDMFYEAETTGGQYDSVSSATFVKPLMMKYSGGSYHFMPDGREITGVIFPVLVEDDEPIEAEHARTVLEEAGIKADACSSGQEALRMMEEQHNKRKPYNLVLMDWNMPGMNGLEATAAIRALDREDAKRIPIIALTANAFDEDAQRSLQAGMNAHVTKPVEPDYLIRILGELVYTAEGGQ